MDLTYHLVAGMLVSKATTNTWGNEVILLSSIMPDLIGTIPFYFFKIKKSFKEKITVKTLIKLTAEDEFHGEFDKKAYYTTHSLLGITLFSIIAYLLYPEIAFPMMLGYISHILADIPTHSGYWAFRPFFPFENIKIGLGNWWQNKQLSFFMWGILLIISAALIF